MSDAKNLIAKIRSKLVVSDPFFASILMRQIPLESKDTNKLSFDGKHIGYNPENIHNETDIEFASLEGVMHLALGHPWRREGRDKKIWNKACDQSVWAALMKSGRRIPNGIPYENRFADLTAEQTYAMLMKEKQEQGNKDGDNPGDGDGDGNGKGQGNGDGDSEGNSEVKDPAAEDFNESEQETKLMVAQALMAAAGNIPGALKHLIQEAQKEVVDWRAILRRFIQQSAKADFTWARPNPRYIRSGLMLPSLKSERMGTIVVGFDTSGSTWEVQSIFAAECSAIMKELQPERVIVPYVDTRIQKVDSFEPEDELTFSPKGGGGTNFMPFFEYIEREEINPVCLIILTDLENGDQHEVAQMGAPSYPVLWASVNDHGPEAPFGETVKVSLESARR